MLAGSFGTIVLLCCGLPRVTTSIDLLKLFSPDSKLITDYVWFESKLGRLVPMELVVRFPTESLREHLGESPTPEQLVQTYSLLERFEMVQRIQRAIVTELGAEGEDIVGATMSAATFARPLARAGSGFRRNSERYIAENELAENRSAIERTGFLRTDPNTGEELWRVSVRFAAFHGVDHGELVSRLQRSVAPEFASRQIAIEALTTLATRANAVPSGRRVAIVQAESSRTAASSLSSMLASKRVVITDVVAPDEAQTPGMLAKLTELDGVVLGPGVSDEHSRRLAEAGVTLLARQEPNFAAPADGSSVGIAFTGVIPIVYKAQRALLDSLIESAWWSFVTITPLMMFVCRGVAAGAVVMLPNVLPVLVVFGGMGWLGVPVDIGSMMAASIALGVAVDDTIHFLAWFRDDFVELGDRAAAVMSAYRRSATPTLQAALINGLGLSVFATSSFTPTQRFGCLMLAILMAGVLAEVVMLPALLFGPLGRAFKMPKAKRNSGSSEQPKRGLHRPPAESARRLAS